MRGSGVLLCALAVHGRKVALLHPGNLRIHDNPVLTSAIGAIGAIGGITDLTDVLPLVYLPIETELPSYLSVSGVSLDLERRFRLAYHCPDATLQVWC